MESLWKIRSSEKLRKRWGIEVERFRLIVTYEGVFPPEFHEKKHFIYLQCECFIKEGEVIKLDNNEIQEYHWFSLKEAPKQRLLPITKKTVELLIKDSNK